MKNKIIRTFSLFTFTFSLLAANAAEYKVSGTRYLRKYTAAQKSQAYMAETDAQKIANSLCEVAWEKSSEPYATATTHVTTNLDWNVGARESFDAAIWCANHSGDEHVAYANAACYVFEFPGGKGIGALPVLTNLSVNVYSDPYNAYGARISVMASDKLEIPTDCATVRGDAAGGIRTAGACPRMTRTVGGNSYWYPNTTNVVFSSGGSGGLGSSGLQLKRYLFVFVLMENYATSRGYWLEGSSYIDNEIKIATRGTVEGWESGCDIAEPYATRYHLKDGHADEDWDEDGLSNYAEYLISEVFKFAQLDPDNANTSGSCRDFFRKPDGFSLYLGEMFAGMGGSRSLGGEGEGEQRTPSSIKLRTRYWGKRQVKARVVVHAWSQKRDADMQGAPDETYETAAYVVNGKRTAEATRNAAESMGLGGDGTFNAVAFADENGDGKYTPGEPFGFVRNAALGAREIELELTDDSAVFARFDILSGKYAARPGVVSVAVSNETAGVTEAGRHTRVRVVRTLVNGVPAIGVLDSMGTVASVKRVVLDKYLDLGTRSYLHEGDFLTGGDNDCDYGTLRSDISERTVFRSASDIVNPIFIDPTNVTYAVVLGEGPIGTSNLALRCVVNKTFDNVNSRMANNAAGTPSSASVIRPVIDPKVPQGLVYGARPTFRFAMQDGYGKTYDNYTAFNLNITRSGNTYTTGLRRLPPRDADGWYEFTLDDPIGHSPQITTNGTYSWNVSIYDAKFQGSTLGSYNTTWASSNGTFTVNMNNQQPMNDHGYSSIAAAVKYTGPANVLFNANGALRGNVHVQAFANADFAGKPEGAAFAVCDIDKPERVTANAVIRGLPNDGTYYLRAFIDTNGNGVKDEWESWGAANAPVTLSTATSKMPTAGIFIEDMDTDGDWIPDAMEHVESGNLTTQNASVIGGEKIVFSGVASSSGSAGISRWFSSASLSYFQNKNFVLRTIPKLKRSGATLLIESIRNAVENSVNSNVVKLTSIAIRADGDYATISASDEVTDYLSGDLIWSWYNVLSGGSSAVVTVNVYKKNTLAEAGWTLVETIPNVSIGRGARSVDVALDDVDLSSGYYKAEVVQ